jgi:tetratricopeptide (TPR) repeat protein
MEHIRTEYLRGMAGFGWQGPHQAAQFCLRNSLELDQGLAWADQSIAVQENFQNLQTKAGILEKMGKAQEAKALRERAMTLATEADVNLLGYQMMNAGKMDEALALFQKNVKDHPDSWNVYDSLAEGLEKKGDVKGAIANYEKALKRVTDEQNRKRIAETLARLRAK